MLTVFTRTIENPPLKIGSNVYLTKITSGISKDGYGFGMMKYSNGQTEQWSRENNEFFMIKLMLIGALATDEISLREGYPGLAKRIDAAGIERLEKCFLGPGYDQYYTEWFDETSDYLHQPCSSGFDASMPHVHECLRRARSLRVMGAEISQIAVGYEGAWIITTRHDNPDQCKYDGDLRGHYGRLNEFIRDHNPVIYVSIFSNTCDVSTNLQ